MPIGNRSGRNVQYEVEPSDPGIAAPIGLAAALTGAGTAFAALGCLTEIGGEPLTVVGLFLLVAALLADVYAYNKANSAGAAMATAPTGGKKPLADEATDAHVFAPGTWVVFYDGEDTEKVLGVSPPIFKPDATVTLRRCVDSASVSLVEAPQQDHVEVEPLEGAGLMT
jgi:hypothetical protein